MMRRILVVDDDEDILLIIRSLLSGIGDLEIQTALNGKTASQLLQVESFTGLILDYLLPDMTGEELLERISNGQEEQKPIVVMLSARDDVDTTNRWLEKGARAVLPKPFNPLHMKQKLEDIFEL